MAFCSTCGERYLSEDWPRTCAKCGAISWRNAVPVGVLVLPVEMEGYEWPSVLIQQRAIEPERGGWALTGGFIEFGESAEEAGIRESAEELGLHTDGIRLMMTRATKQGRLLIFGVAKRQRLPANYIRNFKPTSEVSAVDVVTLSTQRELCFPTHTEALKKFFSESDRWWY